MLRNTRALLRVLTSGRTLAHAGNRGVVFRCNQLKFYSKKPEEKPEQPPPSILTEDMLAKAGFEEPNAEQKARVEEGEEEAGGNDGGKEEGNRKSGGGSSSSRRRRRLQTSKDLQREKYANWFYISTFVGGGIGVAYMCRDWDSEVEQKSVEGEGIENGYTPGLMYQRLSKRIGSIFAFFSEPAFESLLPPPAPEAYRRPLTLVLSLDDLLIHSEWNMKQGWKTAKRPGLDYFLGYLSQYYEIVIFGSNSEMFSQKAVQKLDPYHAYVSYALFREACRYKDGKLIKDLSLLNRDLAKTVLIDTSSESWALQPENAIPMKPWDGKADDTLVKLIPFLEYLATQPIKDVRPILASFQNKENIIEEFAHRELKLREQWRKENQHLFKNAGRPNAGNFLASLLGVSSSSLNKGPKMPLDVIREHGQLQYEHFQKYLQENAPKFQEEERKLREEFGKTSLTKIAVQGMPTPEEIAKIQAERAKENSNSNQPN